MKREYTKPVSEKVEFHYDDQVVASGVCLWTYDMSEENCAKRFVDNTLS